MELTDIRPIVEFYHSKLAQVTLDFKRYLYPQINWDSRVIGIKGERGVGKTTMLLQRIKEKYSNPDDTFYISLDHYWFGTWKSRARVTPCAEVALTPDNFF